MQETRPKPIIATFPELFYAMKSLHRFQKKHVDNLHDCWMKGAPSPRSRVLNPKGFDERKAQHGNYVARIVFPTLLTKWVQETAHEIGVDVQPADALELLSRVRIAFTGDLTELMKQAN